MNPFFKYFGGKWLAAPHYPIPKYQSIVEPFAGAAGYSIRYFDHQVHLFDLDPIICGVWDFLIHASREDILNLPSIVEDVHDLKICQEAKWLIGFWVNTGVETPMRSPSKWMRETITKNPKQGSFWGLTAKERIASQVSSIRHWTITNLGYQSIIPTREHTWFIDPPYQLAGTRYKCSSSNIDFEDLAKWCKALPGQVMVCENEGATWLPFEPFRTIQGTKGSKRSGKSKEVIWIKDAP